MKIIYFILALLCLSCKNNLGYNQPLSPGQKPLVIETDKSVYKPGDQVIFSINAVPENAVVRYRYLNTTIKEEPVTATSWSWRPPADDFRGYTAGVYTVVDNNPVIAGSIAVDVSSDWSRFPRYGFLSEFGDLSPQKMDSVIRSLARYHLNGLQFYDWHDKHHQPLTYSGGAPLGAWKEIANRPVSLSTVSGYIDRSHQKNMNAMFYNLCYGVLSDGLDDGVEYNWFLFKDKSHEQRDAINMVKPPFKSDIFFTDPAHPEWQRYLAEKNQQVYQALDFDGFHVDQVGDRGTVYRHSGTVVPLAATFGNFLEAMKTAHPEKRLVMNAVNQFGQEGSIADAPVDFLYTEVWTGHEEYKHLASIIRNNSQWSKGKQTVLTAYLNYNKAETKGWFNTPGVLLANAVIFSFGGSHLELGEHLLGKEYFPNNNLQMKEDLKAAMIHYYDFLTGYQNLLRDGGEFNAPAVVCTNNKMKIAAWPPQSGHVSVQGKKIEGKQVLHFLNFANASSLQWRDTDGMQPEPEVIAGAVVETEFQGTVKQVWVSSPDTQFGIPQPVNFQQNGNKITFEMPPLKYWNMIVIE